MTSFSELDPEVFKRRFDALRAMTDAAAPFFIGLTLTQAESLGEQLNRHVRVIEGPSTFAFDYHRLTVVLNDGIVVEASSG